MPGASSKIPTYSFEPRVFFIFGRRSQFRRSQIANLQSAKSDELLIRLIKPICTEVAFSNFSDLVLGCAYPEGEQGYNLARMVALGCGLDCPGVTVNRLCASSLEAVAMAAARIKAGWGDCILVAGVESMSRIPRRGANFSESEQIKSVCPNAYIPNGQTAENVARQFSDIDRKIQEDFAARSHELADAAHRTGKYARQLQSDKRDELIRIPVDRAKMAGLPPAFTPDGVVTAATSSPLTDGATAGLVVSEATARQMSVKSALEIVDVTTSHVAPEVMGLGPVPATQSLLQRNGLTIDDIDAFEINEAFAIQVLASMQELNIPLEKVNCWGGALAIGHPLGASGLRLVMTLHDRLAELGDDGALGIATLCVGGGQGMSMLVRYIEFGD